MTNKEKRRLLIRIDRLHDVTEPADSRWRIIASILRCLVHEIETEDSPITLRIGEQ